MSAGGKEVGRISIRVVPDLDEFRSKVAAEVKGLPDGKVHVDADLDKDGAAEKMRALLTELKAEAAKSIKVKVDVDVDRNRLRGLLGRIGGEAGEGSGIAGGGTVGGGARAGLGMLADQTVLVGAGVVSLVAPALALLATSLATMPALVASVAVPIGVLALGMDGLKKAAQPLVGAFKQMKDVLSKDFQDQFSPILRDVAKFMPQLTQALRPVVGVFSVLADVLAEVGLSKSGLDSFRATMGNISKTMTAAVPGIELFARGMLHLVEGGSKSLPGFGGLLSQFGDRFNNWVGKITKNDFWGTSPLDRAISGLRPVLDSVSTSVGRLMDTGVKMMADPAMAHNIVRFIDGVTDLILALIPATEKLFGAVSKVPGFFSSKPGEWKNPFSFSDKPSGPTPGQPGGPPQRPGDNSDFDHSKANQGLSWMDKNVGGPLMRFFQGKNQWEKTAQGALPWMDKHVGQPLSSGSMFQGIDKGAGDAAANIANGAKNIGNQVSQAFNGVEGQVSAVWNKIAASATAAWNKIVESARKAVSDVMAEIGKLPGQIEGVFKNAAGALEGAGRALMDGLKRGIVAAGQSAVDAAKRIASDITGAVKGLLGIKSPSTVFHGIGVNIVDGLSNGIDSGSDQVHNKIKDLASGVQKSFNDTLGKPSKWVSLGGDFGKANLGQFESDLGISGKGAVSEAANWAIDMGTGMLGKHLDGLVKSSAPKEADPHPQQAPVNIHVNNVDDAIAAHQNVINRRAHQYTRR